MLYFSPMGTSFKGVTDCLSKRKDISFPQKVHVLVAMKGLYLQSLHINMWPVKQK